MQTQQLQAQAQQQQAARDFEASENQKDRDSKMDIEQMKVAAKAVDQDMNDNGVNDQVDLAKSKLERENFR